MSVKLDEWNRKILYELDKDASITLKNLSRKIGRSKEFVSYRIKMLENEKIINGYTAIVDMSKLGYFTFRIYLKFQNINEAKVNEMVEFLKNEEAVWTIAKLQGKWDYAFFLGVKKISDFHDIWRSFLLMFKQNIMENKIALYSRIHNFNKRFFMTGETIIVEKIIGFGAEENFDDLDINIIRIWGKNVRKSSVVIAKKLKTNPKTITNRINSLKKKKIIVGCKIDIDQGKLGYQGYRVDLSLNSLDNYEELFNYCKNRNNIYQINQSIGGADFEFEIIVRDLEELTRIMNEMMTNLPGIIRNYEYFSFLIFPKLTIVPD